MKLMVIDGNSIVNRAFYGVHMLTTRDGQPTNAVFGFLAILNKLLDECDVVVPVTKIPDYVVFADQLAKEYDFRLQSFGHAGDGNLHIYTCSNDMEREEFLRQVDDFMTKLYAKTMELGGQISGEHGIGRGKIKYLAQAAGDTNIALMQGIKAVFDPKMILNPGKIFPMP